MSTDTKKHRRLGTVKDIFLNFNPSMISFVLMRITGLALFAYLVLHLFSLSFVLSGRKSFDGVMGAYDTLLFNAAEYLLLLCVLAHMFNGIRIILVDFCTMTRRQTKFLWYAFFGIMVVGAVGLYFFLPRVPVPVLFPGAH